jgi:hypothetical protein
MIDGAMGEPAILSLSLASSAAMKSQSSGARRFEGESLGLVFMAGLTLGSPAVEGMVIHGEGGHRRVPSGASIVEEDWGSQ